MSGPAVDPSLADGRRHALALATMAAAAGVLSDRVAGAAPLPWLPAAWLALAALAALRCLRATGLLALVAVLELSFALGGYWHYRCWRLFARHELGHMARDEPQPVCLDVRVLAAPRLLKATDEVWGPPLEDHSQMRVRVLRTRVRSGWIPASGQGELRMAGRAEHVYAGDLLRVFGHLRTFRAPSNPGDFDEAQWRRMRRELVRIDVQHAECARVLARAPPWHPRRMLAAVRRGARTQLERYMSAPYAALAAALLIGIRDDVARTTMDAFFETGTIHLLAISGMHLSILVYAVVAAARLGWLTRHQAMALSCGMVIPYTLVTECQPPIVRAALFVLIVCGGRLLARRILMWNVLGAAALCVLAVNPSYLFQIGVQLSFLAVAALSYCARWDPLLTTDPLDLLIQNTRPWPMQWLRRVAGALLRMWLTSLLIWLVTLPLIAASFYLVSPAAIVLNPLLWPPTAAALLTGFALLLLGPLLPWLGPPLGWMCELSLASAEAMVQWASTAAATHFWIPAPSGWWVAGYYLLLAAWAACPAARPRPRTSIGLALAWSLLGVVLVLRPWSPRNEPMLVCTFFAVGHGTCVVVESPDGNVLLYDAGRLGPPQPLVRSVSRYLWSRGISRLSRIVISHADADHFNFVPLLVERFRTERVDAPQHLVDHESPLVMRLRQQLRQHRVPLKSWAAEDYACLPGAVTLETLHPPREAAIGSDNAQSIVLRLGYAGRTILLPGDLESPGLEQVLRTRTAPCDVLMAPHHGSARSAPAEFVAWSQPRFVVISSGRSSAASALKSFAAGGRAVYETSLRGAVRVAVAANGTLAVRTWRSDPW